MQAFVHFESNKACLTFRGWKKIADVCMIPVPCSLPPPAGMVPNVRMTALG